MPALMDILIDLDGTVHDPAPGIIGSAQYALRGLGLPVPPAKDMHWIIGPPLRSMFPHFGVQPAAIDEALRLYRENYSAGAMYDAIVYDGIPAALDAMRADGCRLIMCTSKPHVFAKPIMEKFGLADRFAAIHGAELDGTRDDKGELIAHIIEREAVDPKRAIMIGDRKYDCLGASRHGIPTIGVLWGYGSADELRQQGAARLAEAPGDLAKLVATMRPQ